MFKLSNIQMITSKRQFIIPTRYVNRTISDTFNTTSSLKMKYSPSFILIDKNNALSLSRKYSCNKIENLVETTTDIQLLKDEISKINNKIDIVQKQTQDIDDTIMATMIGFSLTGILGIIGIMVINTF